VRTVLVDELVSVFDGIVVDTDDGRRFVDADQIDTIWTNHVRTNLSADHAATLPPPDGSNLIDIKPPGSAAARLGRFLGRRGR
jgi:hypothetical protein